MINDDSSTQKRDLEINNLQLQDELRKLKEKPRGEISYLFLMIGIIFFGFSIVHNHTLLALTGVALTFWGALLLYVKPIDFIRKDIINVSINGYIENIQKLVNVLDYKGIPKYLSTGTLSSLQQVFLYYPKSESDFLPSDEVLSQNKFYYENPTAIKMVPSGYDLYLLIEKELGVNFSSVNLNYLKNNLKKVIVEGLEMAKTFEMDLEDNQVSIYFSESLFDEIIINNLKMEYNFPLRDPLTSAFACIISSTTRNPTTIISLKISADKKTEIIYKFT